MKQKETVLSTLLEVRDLLKIFTQRVHLIEPAEKPICSKDGRFIRNADGTVLDKQLNLVWHPTFPKRMTWEEAKKECQKIGCRLPTRQELESLLDLTKCNPAIDKEIFPDTKTDDYYWTADIVAGCPGLAWYVGFHNGYVYYWYKDDIHYVRPVRSSQ